MKIDLLYEIQDLRDDRDSFTRALASIEAADRAAFDCVWALDGRMHTELADSAAPDLLLTAATQRTRDIRIGCGATLHPNPVNHPIRIAERIATLDILSGGRVEWCASRASDESSANRGVFAEAIAMIPAMWASEPFSWDGEHFQVPEREIAPKPVQQPHPRVWLAAGESADWETARQCGVGVLALATNDSLERVAQAIADHRTAKPTNAEVGALAFMHCTESGAKTPPDIADPSWCAERRITGDASHCIRELERYREAGCDRVLVLGQANSLPHAETLASIVRIGRDVIPHFANT
jgi:alkanesulfonate monooxygenase SsuD/methylene tetrahydromethanopterin reductase-like flavin-dependent oxidoreductase (luciferase family)